LYEAFRDFFDQSLDAWRRQSRLISSSKFLMGDAQNKFFKKAWITGAIKEETIEWIRGGEFKLGDCHYERFLEKENNVITEQFRKSGWNGRQWLF